MITAENRLAKPDQRRDTLLKWTADVRQALSLPLDLDLLSTSSDDKLKFVGHRSANRVHLATILNGEVELL